jgi:hypothetical protein
MQETVIAEYARQLMEAHGERAIAEAAQRAVACEQRKDKRGLRPGGMSKPRSNRCAARARPEGSAPVGQPRAALAPL